MLRRNKLVALTFILFLLTTSSILSANELIVHFLDVGQADSILLQLPNDETMLIDAGNNGDGDFVVNYIHNLGILKIDYLIGTHPHEDHIGGLDDVIKSFEIGQIYMPRVTHTTKSFEDVLLAIKAKDKKINSAKARIAILAEPDLKAYFLSPSRDDYEDLNHWSAVIKIEYGNTSFLFTGDAEEINELEMLASSTLNPNVDVLKVGHHGSHSSTSKAFLDAVSPHYAVISVGKDNNYGHPSPLVLDKLYQRDITVLRTDELGTIKCFSDGEKIWFNKFSKKKASGEATGISKVEIIKVDLKAEIVTIKNTGEIPVDLSGWNLFSLKGEQNFFFPAGTKLEPGEKIKIASGKKAQSGPGIIIWTRKYIWNNNGDPAKLYDQNGNLVSSY